MERITATRINFLEREVQSDPCLIDHLFGPAVAELARLTGTAISVPAVPCGYTILACANATNTGFVRQHVSKEHSYKPVANPFLMVMAGSGSNKSSLGDLTRVVLEDSWKVIRFILRRWGADKQDVAQGPLSAQVSCTTASPNAWPDASPHDGPMLSSSDDPTYSCSYARPTRSQTTSEGRNAVLAQRADNSMVLLYDEFRTL